MIKILVKEETALNLLMDRVQVWTGDNKVITKLYETMYQSYIDWGCFEDIEFDPMIVVDNDYINYCQVLSKEDCNAKDWDKLAKLYEEGERDISCEEWNKLNNYSFIEAMNEEHTVALMRW